MKIGIVGCGQIAKKVHIPAFQKMRNNEIVAICDNNEFEAKKVGKLFNVSSYSNNLADMLTKNKLDIVDICTPPHTHASLSIQAMEAGCNVLIEKPFALNKEEADSIIQTSKKNNVKLCVVHNYLFKPVVIKAKKIIENGNIGNLLGMNVNFLDKPDVRFNARNHWSHSIQGGRFGENIIHPLYLIDDFLGIKDIESVSAKKIGACKWTAIDELRVLLNTNNNSIGTITLSTNAPKTNNSIDIIGTKAILHIDLVLPGLFIYKEKKETIFYPVGDYLSNGIMFLIYAISTPISWIMQKNYIRSGHYYLIQKFIESIRDDKEPPITGEKTRKMLILQKKILDLI